MRIFTGESARRVGQAGADAANVINVWQCKSSVPVHVGMVQGVM
jgi:hypothetical protein